MEGCRAARPRLGLPLSQENGDPGQEVGLTASIAVRIQHHPSRAPLADNLAADLDGFSDVRVVADPKPDGPPNTWRAHRACLVAMPDAANYLLVLQDDAIPCQHFASKLLAGIALRPETILICFTPGFKHHWQQFVEAKKQRKTLIPFRVGAYLPTVAILYPADVSRRLVAWTDEKYRARAGSDDGIAADFTRKHKLQPYAFVPCICDHNETVLSVGRDRLRKGTHRRAALL